MATVPTADYISDLERTVDETTDWLVTLPDDVVRWRPRANAWSPIEIMGHLIDSAANNHRRFVEAQLQQDMIFDGYAQDAWVRLQQYQESPWPDLVGLWAAYNDHLADVVRAMPIEALDRPRPRHNLHEVAWQPVAEDRPATLGWFVRDYVGHLEHHLAQIRALLAMDSANE